MIGLRRVGSDGFTAQLEPVISIYSAAMRPPADQLSGRKSIMRNHATYPDFTCIFAELTDGTPVGFAYGFHGVPGQWWHDVISRAVAERLGSESSHEWLDDTLELAEIHVHPDHQGKGIGRRMIHALCEGRKERTAVLSTHDQPTAARHLYRNMGFRDLLSQFVFPGGHEHYAIVGRPLPLTPQD
ncbi:GNAT family N-acetyltransferase [Sinosporangium siamense]|uniref:Acetyltransferase n=1 Tax=Sinosporangium siamense TaxID=1367973 RepID=A0A919V2T1_9ACTN|nr:GNAT family N-acetyltransferase [Sinosporangium siamense]GII90255.1 acetyltransferase [Sinosporangium siamense]